MLEFEWTDNKRNQQQLIQGRKLAGDFYLFIHKHNKSIWRLSWGNAMQIHNPSKYILGYLADTFVQSNLQ